MKKPTILLLAIALCASFSLAAQNGASFADAKYAEIGKRGLEALSAGHVDQWMASFADNARYVWNYGDSLVGKSAISQYWKTRRADVIKTIRFDNQIWLPINVAKPQAGEAPGVWLLSWYQTTATYANGKTMTQGIHTAMHFDANDKIDYLIQYLDRTSINAAAK